MEYEKTQFFKMSHGTDCLAPPPATQQASAAATEATTTLKGISTTTFRIGAVTNFFLSTPAAASEALCPSITTPPGDPYASYADNFDLSLLPQDCAAPVEEHDIHGIKRNNCTPGYEYNHGPRRNAVETPHIKIEQAWPQTNFDDIKQEAASSLHYEQGQPQHCHNLYQPHHQLQVPVKTVHQLIPPPPPPYPHAAYPSPQSSPAQSDYGFPQSLGFASPYESLSSSRSSLYHPSSPCPSLSDASVASSLIARVKQELHILPPSPPESSCETPSPQSSANTPFDIKSEPFDNDTEALVDLNTLIEKEVAAEFTPKLAKSEEAESSKQDHQLLREYLEDNSFQKRHNLKPLALESFFGGLEEVHGDIEPVISLALENAKREADETCAKLQISQDPSVWTPAQVHAWLRSTIAQFKLPQIDNLEAKFCENGAALILVSEEEFVRRAPESGSFLHAQLEIWKLSFTDCYQMSPATANSCLPTENEWCSPQYPLHTPMEDADDNDTDDEDDSTPSDLAGPLAEQSSTAHSTMDPKRANATAATKAGRTGGSHIHLWQFLKELLSQPHVNGTAIRWMDRSKGVFKIEDSVRVAKLWGKRKNRPAMNYDKLSRSIRQYYKKGIMKKTERSQRLVYQFCHPYHL